MIRLRILYICSCFFATYYYSMELSQLSNIFAIIIYLLLGENKKEWTGLSLHADDAAINQSIQKTNLNIHLNTVEYRRYLMKDFFLFGCLHLNPSMSFSRALMNRLNPELGAFYMLACLSLLSFTVSVTA